jgi:thioredoxin-related protein
MKKVFYIILIILSLFFLTSCQNPYNVSANDKTDTMSVLNADTLVGMKVDSVKLDSTK